MPLPTSVETIDRTVSPHRALVMVRSMVDARPLLLVSDFDGTLSPIVLDPWGARIIPAAQRALRRLASADGVHVVLLSGRLSRDLAGRARVGGATYIGNFGMERGALPPRGRPDSLSVQVVDIDPSLVALADRLAAEVPLRVDAPWLVVEHKPASVAFHFRAAPDLDQAAADVLAAVDEVDPDGRLTRYPGRRAMELRPHDAPAKGDAFRALLEEHRPAAALMLGDDVSDVPAFLALRDARANGRMAGLAIGVRARDEVPPAVEAAVDVVLGSPADAARFLSGLAAVLAPRALPERS